MILFFCALSFADGPPPAAEVVLGGASHTALDLWRPYRDADKVYVMAGLPDGTQELFMVDTGASISVLSEDVAERLSLTTRDTGLAVQGLGGRVPWIEATIPSLTLGEFELHAVNVAVGVAGVPDRAGALPIAGILGNNIWSNFALVLDYNADLLDLYLPNAYKTRGRSAPLHFDGYHAYAELGVVAERDDVRIKRPVIMEIDTGAYDLLFASDTGEPFRPISSVGVEPVYGLGVDLDKLPEDGALRSTRRIPVKAVKLGNRWIDFEDQARWIGADEPLEGPAGMLGLIGYQTVKDHVLIMDFPGRRVAVTRSKRPARDFDANRAYLERERARYGDAPERAFIRANLLIALDDLAGARATLEAGLKALPEDAELNVLYAGLQRYEGQWEQATATLGRLSPDALAEQGEWITYVNMLLLLGRIDDALKRATDAVATGHADFQEDYLIALSDALLATGQYAPASAALDDAVAAGQKGHLMRKARIAMLEGDRYGAIVALRRLINIYPVDGTPLWMYGQLVDDADVSTYLADLEAAVARLHPGDEPWDFSGAGLIAAGREAEGRDALQKGMVRDCVPLPAGPDRSNCEAWYWALGGERLDEAQARIDEALAASPQNSAYLDTAGVVALARGDVPRALELARKAAWGVPDNPYLLWQLTQMEQRARAAGPS